MFKGLDKNSKVSVIIPAYNEEIHIYGNIKDIFYLFQKLGYLFEIIIIDDASSDNTFEQAKKAQIDFHNIIVKRNAINYGKGWSVKKGFSYATGNYIVFLDADFELDPRQIERFFAIMQEDKSDIVIGCKRHRQSKIVYPLHRKVLSIGYFFLVKLLFGLPIRDTQTGLKLFKYEALKQVMPKLLIKTYAFDLEILVLAFSFGFKISEAPIVVNYKVKFGHIGFSAIITILIDTLAIYYRLNILKYYDYPRSKTSSFPKVSILVATKEKTRYLEECIELCQKLDYSDYEIIVLPDKEFSWPDPGIKIVPTGRVLPPTKRDIGARYAQGEILAFLDDDSYPKEDWLMQAVKNFGHSKVAAVGGPAVNPAKQSIAQRVSGMIFSSRIVSGSHVFRYIPRMLREVDDYPSCNFLVRKRDFEAVNGFSTKFWPGEDTFLCFKIKNILKKKILYDPEAIVYHYRRALFLPHLKQISRYALHHGYFAKRFPQTSLKIPYFLPSIFTIYVLGNLVLFNHLNNFFTFAYFFLGILYFILVAFAAIRTLDRRCALLVFIGIPLTHLSYGLFFIKGLLAQRMPEEKGVNKGLL